jgi:hypothetical protein
MDWKQYVAIAALVVSIISFVLTYSLSKRTAVTGVRPVLVFEYTENAGWIIRNVGNGPALNIVVAMKGDNTDWVTPVRIPPLSKDGMFKLAWVGHSNVRTLGAYYSDIAQRRYSSTCTDDLSGTHEGNQLREWPDSEISRHWHYYERQ